MKNFIVIICLFASLSIINAQEAGTIANQTGTIQSDDDETKWLNNRLGLYASFMSGYGWSYQYQFENGFSLKTQMFAHGRIDNEEYYSNQIRFAWGADVQYNLQKTEYTRLYALVGTFYEYYESVSYNNSNALDVERYYNFGIGVGLEVVLWENAAFAVEGGYYGKVGNNDIYNYNNYINNSKPKSLGFGVGGGIFYAF